MNNESSFEVSKVSSKIFLEYGINTFKFLSHYSLKKQLVKIDIALSFLLVFKH